MGFIQKILANHKEKVKSRNDACDNLIVQIDIALQEIDTLFIDTLSFIDPSKEIEWRNRNAHIISNVSITNIQKLKKATHYKKLLEKQAKLYSKAKALKPQIGIHNNLNGGMGGMY